MFLLNGTPIQIDAPFTANDINYPPGWIRSATVEQRKAVGITEAPDPVRPDDRFYYADLSADGLSYTKTPKDIAGLKAQWKETVNSSANSALFPSDWMVVRQVESSVAVPTDWATYRTDVRAYANSLHTKIDAVTTIDELIAVIDGVPTPVPDKPGETQMTGGISWPIDPTTAAKIAADKLLAEQLAAQAKAI